MAARRFLALVTLSLALAAAPPCLWAGPYEDGLAAYQAGDYPAALRSFRLAAEQGNADAQFNLGFKYASGQGVPQDDKEALRWYRLAAEQGLAAAQAKLGVMYDNGQGVPQDYKEAVRWFRLAAEQGHTLAQSMLGFIYDMGRGVPQDSVQAHLWFNLAAAQGDQKAAKWRDDLAGRMTPAQIAEAQRLAREWRPKQAAPAKGAATQAPALPGFVPDEPKATDWSAFPVVPVLPGIVPDEPKATGSGFVVSAAGDVLTNRHVVEACARLTARVGGARHAIKLVRADARNDLALLRMEGAAPSQARFREGRGIRAGDSVVVLGYPLSGLLASEANVTTGTVSALSGPGDDSRLLQISAPVQPGNSGGPILDGTGNVVGIVVSKLDALRVAAATGDIPQNVNFGIHAAVARTFLDAAGVDYRTAPPTRALDPATIAAEAKAYTVRVECW